MRLSKLAALCLAAFVVAAFALSALAQGEAQNGIAVSEAWARATPPAARTGAVYATIRNSGGAPDRLIGIESDVADGGVIHEMTMEGDVMRMRPLTDGVVVAPGETVALAPGGLHGMLIDLKQPLKAGDTFHATAVFETAGRIEISVPVVAMGAAAPGGPAMEGMSSEGHGMNMNQSEGKP